MRLFKLPTGIALQLADETRLVEHVDWDDLVADEALPERVAALWSSGTPALSISASDIQPPIGRQELWASGVTYFRSRTARMEESSEAGGSDFYDRVYHADRPELFFKGTSQRIVPPGGDLHRRRDSSWIVSEPELTLVISRTGVITGYTIGNDFSCRDIEGENPLYLPQAKTFDGCASIGPCIWVSASRLPAETAIQITIMRGGGVLFNGETHLNQMKQSLDNLVEHLFREASFPHGALLMTGTGIVPPDDFSHEEGDEVHITIEPIGTLKNRVD